MSKSSLRVSRRPLGEGHLSNGRPAITPVKSGSRQLCGKRPLLTSGRSIDFALINAVALTSCALVESSKPRKLAGNNTAGGTCASEIKKPPVLRADFPSWWGATIVFFDPAEP